MHCIHLCQYSIGCCFYQIISDNLKYTLLYPSFFDFMNVNLGYKGVNFSLLKLLEDRNYLVVLCF